ncbi:hypothetical protein RRSWK_03536 [Rhodopirellula sp. SWK7]|nr:hypothetical protein RRSWK_03536 [Rhodopirellula sp. SWK7]
MLEFSFAKPGETFLEIALTSAAFAAGFANSVARRALQFATDVDQMAAAYWAGGRRCACTRRGAGLTLRLGERLLWRRCVIV